MIFFQCFQLIKHRDLCYEHIDLSNNVNEYCVLNNWTIYDGLSVQMVGTSTVYKLQGGSQKILWVGAKLGVKKFCY
jgi:hypothetical protein